MRSLTLLVLLAAQGWALAQEMEAGREYPGGSSLRNSYFGVQVRVPRGFAARLAEENGVQALGMGSPEGVGALLLFQFGVPQASYRRLLSQPLPLGEARLEPRQAPRSQGNRVSVRGADGERGLVARSGSVNAPSGASVLLLVVGPVGLEARVAATFDALVAGLQFSKPLAGGGDAKLRQAWQNRLLGRLLSGSMADGNSSANGSGGVASDTRLALCRGGRFVYESRSTAFVSIPGGSGVSSVSEDGAEGTWALEFAGSSGAILALTDSSGLQRRVNVRMAGGRVLLDGRAVSLSPGGC